MKTFAKAFFFLFFITAFHNSNAQQNKNDSSGKILGQPLLINYTVPANGATDVVSSLLEIYWWEYLYKGTGFINIRRVDNDSLVQQIDVLSSSVVIQSNYTSIPLAPLEGGDYYVEIMPGTFWNLEGSAFAGTVKGNWNFSVHNYVTVKNGNWNSKGTWAGSLIPPYNAAVTIKHDIVVTDDYTSCFSLKLLNPGSVTVNQNLQFFIYHQ